MTTTASEALFRQYVVWYEAQVAEGRLPKLVCGVAADGRRFTANLDALELGHFQRNKLIRYMLELERAEQYVYATPVRVEDEETGKISEQVLIVCATADDYVGGSWNVVRAADGEITLKSLGEWSGQDPGQTPGTWFLTSMIVLEPDERARYAALWAELREKDAVRGADR